MTNPMQTLSQQEQEYFLSRGETSLQQEHNGQIDNPDAQENNIGLRMDKQDEPITPPEKANHFSRTVPHGALHAEREEHKKTRAALAQLRTEHAHILTQLDTTHQNPSNQNEATEQQQDQENQLWQVWEQSRQTSKAELPDFDQALGFLAAMREQQLRGLGQIDGRFQDTDNRTQQMQTELRELIKASIDRGENPAKTIYGLARTYGYGTPDTSSRFKALDQAQKAARTLTASNGGDAGDPILMETLANLSESDFARWYEANPDSFRRLFAG